MIVGIGNDVVELERVRKILNQASGERFINRILTADEKKLAPLQAERLAEFIAGRFAAKEAIVKAFGCGIGEVMGFQDMSIVRDSLGKPICNISTSALERLKLSENIHIHVSITHTSSIASAFAVAELRKLNS